MKHVLSLALALVLLCLVVTGRSRVTVVASLSGHLTRRPDAAVRIQGRHLVGPFGRRQCDPADPQRVVRVRAGVEPRRQVDRVRLGPLRQFRCVRHAGDGGEAKRLTYHSTREVPSSFTADDAAVLFTATRQDLATHVQFPTGGMTELYSVPVSRRPRVARADDAGARCDGQLRAATRSSSTITKDTRATGASITRRRSRATSGSTTPSEEIYASSRVQWRGPQSRFRCQRQRLLLPQRAERLVQRLQEQSRNPGADRPPSPNSQKHPVRFLTRAKNGTLAFCYDGELYTMAPGGEPKKVAFGSVPTAAITIERIVPVNGGMTEAKLVAERQGVRVRIPRRDLRQQHRRQVRQADHEHAVAGTHRQLQPGRTFARLRRGERTTTGTSTRSSLTRKQEPYFFASTVLKEEAGGRDGCRGISARVLARRKGDRLPREPADAQGLQPRVRSSREPCCPRTTIIRTRTAISTTLVARLEVAAGAVRPEERMFAPEVGMVSADGTSPSPQSHPERLRRCRAEMGDWTGR